MAGLSTGIVFLTKAEIFLALSISMMSGYYFFISSKIQKHSKNILQIIIFLIGFFAPITFFYNYLSHHLGSKNTFIGLLGAWPYIISGKVANLDYYRELQGTKNLSKNICDMVIGLFSIMFAMSAALLISFSMRNRKKNGFYIAIAVILLVASAKMNSSKIPWLIDGPPLPLLMLAIISILIIFIQKHNGDEKIETKLKIYIILCLFSFILLFKIIFNIRFKMYGIFLAMPGIVAIVIYYLYLLPSSLLKMNNKYNVNIYRNIIVIIIILNIVSLLKTTIINYNKITFDIGRPPNIFKAYNPELIHSEDKLLSLKAQTTLGIKIFMEKAREIIPQTSSFVVIPEGVMLNFLLRQPNPTPYINFVPPELVMFGEKNIIQKSNESNIDYVIIVHYELPTIYNVNYYGKDANYGSEIMKWIEENYSTKEIIMNDPMKEEWKFGIKIMERKKY